MKQASACPKCDGQRIMHLVQVADAADWIGRQSGDMSQRDPSIAVPRRVLLRKTVTKGVFGGASEALEFAGEVEAYVCADCGYLEEYLRDPQSIDWDRVVGARPHSKPQPGGPFR
jgi:hypothetical protein